MKTAVISLTEQGRMLSRRVREILGEECTRYCFHRHTDGNAVSFQALSALTAQLFPQYEALIFICACGIAVRMTAPHIRSKLTDPAVLVLNDTGQFVIPLLSGHIGGANALARRLAAQTGAQAVITTATDSAGAFSPDCFAAANGLLIADMDAAKEVAAAVLDGETVGLVSDYPYQNLPDCIAARTDTRTGICIRAAQGEAPFPVTLHLVPKNIVLGVGCRRGTDPALFAGTVLAVLAANGTDFRRICAVASIDLKKEEPAILEFCQRYALPVHFYPAAALMQAAGTFSSSAYVQRVTGVDNVCERSAVLCSGGKLVMQKTAGNGITAAAAEKPFCADFGRDT